MAGIQGHVLSVGKAAGEFPRVLSKADAQVSGTFLQAGSHLLTFEPEALPYRQFLSWVLPPSPELPEGPEDRAVRLNDLEGLEVSDRIFSRGADGYRDGRVLYLRLEDGQGRAVVWGSQAYPLRFSFREGAADRLACGCPCGGVCKHIVAVLLQLKKLLHFIEAAPEPPDTWTAVAKPVFYAYALDANPQAVLRLDADPK